MEQGELVTYKCRDSLKQLGKGLADPPNGNKQASQNSNAWTTRTSCSGKIMPVKFFLFLQSLRGSECNQLYLIYHGQI